MSARKQLIEKIAELKRSKNAVILAHNYQSGEVQDVADYVGDSLGLAYKARESQADVILFCGVHFMAETAKIVNPSKKVLVPDKDAGCSLSDSCPADKLSLFLDAHRSENYYVVAYINCSAGVKALSDVICTSGNAARIVGRVPAERKILFVPDRNLGEWVTQQTGRSMTLWEGSCHVHMAFTRESMIAVRERYPDAIVLAHPECVHAVRSLADEVCSTEKMVSYCRQSASKSFIIATEADMLHRLKKELPDREFIAAPPDAWVAKDCKCAHCEFMKCNTLEKMLAALESGRPEIDIEAELRERAFLPVERMLEWSRT